MTKKATSSIHFQISSLEEMQRIIYLISKYHPPPQDLLKKFHISYKNSVTTSKLADGAVTTSKIANHTITPNKISGISKLVFAQCTIPHRTWLKWGYLLCSSSWNIRHGICRSLKLTSRFRRSYFTCRVCRERRAGSTYSQNIRCYQSSGRANVANNTFSPVVLTCDTIECHEQTTVLKFS